MQAFAKFEDEGIYDNSQIAGGLISTLAGTFANYHNIENVQILEDYPDWRSVVKSNRALDLSQVVTKGVTKYSFHSHRFGADHFSDWRGDIGVYKFYKITHNFMINSTGIHYYNLSNGYSFVGPTNNYLMRSVWGF